MDQQQTSTDWLAANLRETVGAGAQQEETTQATLEASRAVFEAYAQAANALRVRADRALRMGVAVMEAGMNANCDHLNGLVEARNLQDVMRLQMLWGANRTLAMFRELKSIGPADDTAGVKTKQA